MTQRFEYQDGKSHKFWEIKVEGNSHTVRYGKVGTDGRLITKEFGSPEETQKSATKLIAQKTKKGYASVGAPPIPADAPQEESQKAKRPEPAQAKKASPKTATQPSNPSTGVHRLEFQDGKSHKFWEIKVEGSAHTVCYGKAGTDGRQSTKEFDSPEEAQKSATKLIAQKTKKGYAPVGGGATPPATPSAKGSSAAPEAPASSNAPADIGNVPASTVSLRPSGTGEWKKLPFSGFALAVRPDGLFITSKAKDRKHWAAVDENGTVVYEEDRNVFAAAFSPDGSRLVVLPEEKERIELYDTATFKPLKSVRCFAMQVSFDESGSRIGIVQTDKVAILGAETLAYQYVIRSKFAQSIRFQDNKIHIGGDVMQIIDDPGIGEEHAKRPKATKFEGWAINRSDNTFNIESGVVINNSRVIDLQSKVVMRFDGKISRGFSATGRTMYSKRRNTPCTFRRIGETKIIATYPEKPDWSEWYCSVDGTRMVTRFENENEISLWTQTEFPAEASPAPSYQLPDDIPPGFADDFSLSYVVYGTQLEVPFTKLRELANAVFAKEDATWAAVPAGDATKTTGYGPTDTVRIAVGIAIAKAQGGYQGKKSDPSAIKSADIKAAAKAWSNGSEALQQKLTPFGLELGDPETLLVATGPLSQATFQSGKESTATADIVPIELGRSGKLFCTYD